MQKWPCNNFAGRILSLLHGGLALFMHTTNSNTYRSLKGFRYIWMILDNTGKRPTHHAGLSKVGPPARRAWSTFSRVSKLHLRISLGYSSKWYGLHFSRISSANKIITSQAYISAHLHLSSLEGLVLSLSLPVLTPHITASATSMTPWVPWTPPT